MSKHERYALVAGLAVAVMGLVISVMKHEGLPFARSGAGVVVVAILFGALQLRERVRSSPAFVDEVIRKSHAEHVDEAVAAGLARTKAEEVVSGVEEKARNEVKQQVDRSSRRLLRVELGLLIAGTLIWGFGDIPVDALFRNDGNCQKQCVRNGPGSGRSQPVAGDGLGTRFAGALSCGLVVMPR